jgi:hypothetical protein
MEEELTYEPIIEHDSQMFNKALNNIPKPKENNMHITGTIAQVGNVDSQDNNGNQYQWLTINTAQGPVSGRKGSKTAFTPNDVGKQVEFEVIQKSGQKGPYNYFKKPPQQGGGQQGGNKSTEECIIRQCAFKSMPDTFKEHLTKAIYDNDQAQAIADFQILDRIAKWMATGKATETVPAAPDYSTPAQSAYEPPMPNDEIAF